MFMSVLSACMHMYHMCIWFPWSSKEGIRLMELELWMNLNHFQILGTELEPLQEQQVFLPLKSLLLYSQLAHTPVRFYNTQFWLIYTTPPFIPLKSIFFYLLTIAIIDSDECFFILRVLLLAIIPLNITFIFSL